MAWYDRLAVAGISAALNMRDFCWIRSFALTEAFGPRKKDFKPSRKQAREKQAKYKLCQKQDEEAKLSELYKADHYISRWRKKLLRASLHSLRGSRTAHSWKSEGPYYLPNPSLRGTVDRKAPSKPPHSSKREGKGPMYLHDPCRFYPIYTRSQSPIGPATTPQNESSCGTFYFWRNSGGT